MSSAYTEQDLREAQDVTGPYYKREGLLIQRIAALISLIRSEARAGMREACAKAMSKHFAGNTLKAYASTILAVPDLAADEAIERIKAESYEKGMQAGAKDEALLQYIFDEPGPIKDGIERIKREARLEESRSLWNQDFEDAYNGGYLTEKGRDYLRGRIAALSGKETA